MSEAAKLNGGRFCVSLLHEGRLNLTKSERNNNYRAS